MCGISGIYLKNNEIVETNLLEKFNKSLGHRGPDATGIFQYGPIGLCHTRLSILDLSESSNQPLVSEDKKNILVYNGEIYNYLELKEQLESEGVKFKTTGDSEVLLKGLIHYGDSFIKQLNGIFSFAFLDLTERPKLTLVRDRFGIKPLFYSINNGRLVFGSELKPLLEVDWIKREIEPQNLFYFLKFGHVPCPRSIFKGIEQLEPGHILTFCQGTYQISKYWDLYRQNSGQIIDNEQEALKAFDEILERTIKRQTLSDVPVGIFLSGGIDSSLLTAAYMKFVNKPIKTFSIGYQEAEFDESSYAKIVAKEMGTEHFDIRVTPQDLFNLIEKVPHTYDQPFADPTMLPTMLLCQKTREHVTVALSGDGGDELFFGYTYQQMMFRLKPVQYLPYQMRRPFLNLLKFFMNIPIGHKTSLKRQQVAKFCDILGFKNIEEFYMYFIGTIGPFSMGRIHSLLDINNFDHTQHYKEISSNLKGVDYFEKLEILFQKTFMVDTVLQKTDRASMAFGLEARVPFLDNEIFDFSKKLSPKLKYKNGIKKYLLRKSLSKFLPPEISDRPKQGFSIPMREWIRTDLKYLVDEYLSEKRIEDDQYLNFKNIKKVLTEHQENRANHSHIIWSLVVYSMWKEKYKVNL